MLRLVLFLFLFLGGASRAQGDAIGQAGRPTTGLGFSEAELRQRLRSAPGDFETRWRLAELLAATARPADAVRELEAAVRIAPTPFDQGRVWFRIGQERARLGLHDEALDAYERKLALGDVDAATLSKSAELLMVLGRLRDSADRYREAIEVEERREPGDPASNGREGRTQIARAYLGLAVALDRDARPIASREAIGRALALDPGLAALGLAGQAESGADFVTPGDASYTLGLAREGQGRATDAAAAFQDYLRVTTGAYARQARDHLARLAAGAAAPTRGNHSREAPGGDRREPVVTAGRDRSGVPSTHGGRPLRLRVVHQATLSADGPLVAPLIDAAWRMDPRLVHLLDECLSSAMLPEETQSSSNNTPAAGDAPRLVRSTLSLELRIEDTGRVSAVAVSVRSPGVLGAGISPCIEATVRGRLRVSRPALRKPTRARMELVLAPVATDGV